MDGNSIVFVVGAWEGKHAQFYADKYSPQLYLFEPQEIKARKLEVIFRGRPNVKILACGLGERTGVYPMSRVGTDRCSFVSRLEGIDIGEPTFAVPLGAGKMVEFGKAMTNLGIREIDLCLMNCEGYEFRLLPCPWP